MGCLILSPVHRRLHADDHELATLQTLAYEAFAQDRGFSVTWDEDHGVASTWLSAQSPPLFEYAARSVPEPDQARLEAMKKDLEQSSPVRFEITPE